MQSVYAWKMGGEGADQRVIEKNMLNSVDQIYDLYVYLLNLLKFQKEIAEDKIEIGKNKNFPTKEDLNPNLRFVNNPIFGFLEENEELNEYSSKNKQLTWDNLENDYPKQIYNNIVSGEEYAGYMNSPENSFKKDKSFIIDVYEKYFAANEDLADWMEEKNLYWVDDFHVGNSMVVATLKSFIPKSTPRFQLFKVYKDKEDQQFIVDLFRRTIENSDETKKIIEEKAQNWELDRIAILDLIILQMGLTEFLYFKNVPPRVILNEYIELSKAYSTDNSHVFVNGILDKVIKEKDRF